MNEEAKDDSTVDRETDAAAAEAGAVGGPGPNEEELDPAGRASREGGGGEAEGFEEAERELIEHASHGDPAPDPESLASDEQDHPEADHGAADHEHSTGRRDEDVEG